MAQPSERFDVPKVTCSECDQPASARGWCRVHYARAQRKGTVQDSPLSRGRMGRLSGVDPETLTAHCSVCDELVDLRARQKAKADGVIRTVYECKPCNQRLRKSRYLRNEKGRHYERRHRQHGISREEYQIMVESQDGNCLICQKPPRTRRLVIDHDHATGAVRGLLCHHCNVAIGFFYDDTAAMTRAVKYVSRRSSR